MTVHITDGLDLRPSDGWHHGFCSCGWSAGPFPDVETTVDALMEHAYNVGRASVAEAASPADDGLSIDTETRHLREQEARR